MDGDKISNEPSVFDKWTRNQGFGSKDLAFPRESEKGRHGAADRRITRASVNCEFITNHSKILRC
jgi:hypothetical protein